MRRSLILSFILVALIFSAGAARGQDLEPRWYSNSPVGMNFFIAGYGYSEGSVGFDPAVPITDAHLHSDTLVAAYAHVFDAWGQSAKFDVILPATEMSGTALLNGQQRAREVSGFGDPRIRFSINFHGAPSLSIKEFSSYHQNLIIGASFQVSAPLGQYDSTKLVNIGTNRWALKSELGVSKAWDNWILEVAPGVVIYQNNNDFFNGGKLEQDPLYTLQGHLVRGFRSGVWAALDGTFYTGGRTTVNGDKGDTLQHNTRVGATLAVPVDRYTSIKFAVSSGTSSRTGSNFNTVAVAWQRRWAPGY